MRKHYSALLLFASLSLSAYAQTSQWAWISGNNTNLINRPSVYGIKGVAAPANKPGGRNNAVSWTDASGNLWLFGGIGQTSSPTSGGGELNDLWKYTPLTNQWTWIGGDTTARQPSVYGTKGVPSSANKPGARKGAVSWTDASGNLWLFGGSSTIARFTLNDLWKYNIATNQWTWVGGDTATNMVNYGIYGSRNVPSSANKPGSRSDAISWTDTGGNLWLFGGFGFARPCYCQVIGGEFVGHLNDLWKYNITSNQWTWVSGDSSIRQQGVYGTRGVPAPTNKPGGRQSSGSWADNNGNLWLYGGDGWASTYGVNSLGDLWRFNIASGLWTYMHGDTTLLPPAVYGTRGVASPANKPGGRYEALSWPSTGDTLWFFGGGGPGGYYSDLWIYKTTTNQWTWIAGDSLRNQRGVYDNKAVPTVNTKPGSRTRSVTWRDAGGNLWLHSGFGNTATTQGYLNDLWKYTLAPANSPGPASFTTNGKVTTEAGGVLDGIEAMKFQPDGKFVVAGTGGGVNFSVARYNADGSLDNTFSGDGKVVTAIGTDVDSRAYDLVIQPDGKIIVAGVVYNEGGFNLDFALVRYNTDGTLDNAFDGDGISITDFSGGREDQIGAVSVQPDGKIVVAGWSFNGSDYDFVLARYTAQGSLDPSFNGDGKVVTDFIGKNDKAHSLALQSDGRIVVGGESFNGSDYDFALARYTTTGALDPSFDEDGKVITDISGQDLLHALVIQPNGSIVAAGTENTSLSNGRTANDEPNSNLALVRYTLNGSLDNSFDGDGKVTKDLGTTSDQATDITLQSDGKLVVAASTANDGDFTVLRFQTNGNADPSFFGTGISKVDFDNRPDFARALSVNNGDIYVAGRTAGTASDDFALARISDIANSPLPVRLTEISASLSGEQTVELKWKTASEQGTSHFEVERSGNGLGFSKIGQVQAAGTTTAEQRYTFLDKQALPLNYYRLQIRDINGQKEQSKTVVVRTVQGKNQLSVYPSPAAGVVQVQSSLRGNLQLQLHDAAGREVKRLNWASASGGTLLLLDLSILPKGPYVLTVTGSEEKQSIRFLKE